MKLLFKTLTVLACWAVLGCDGRPLIENSTVRYELKDPGGTKQIDVRIMRDRRDCISQIMGDDLERFDKREFSSYEEQLAACVPFVNRQTGEVSVSFALWADGGEREPLRLPLDAASVKLLHNGGPGKQLISTSDTEAKVPWVFEPHDPRSAGQLFVVIVDHSGSMNETESYGGKSATRMEWVKEALKASEDVFIQPKSTDEVGHVIPASTVALFRFGGGVGGPDKMRLEGMDGEHWSEVQPITTRKKYRQQVSKMGKSMGWTHLYDVVNVVSNDLLKGDTYLSRFLSKFNKTAPTIIVLTDGFNNVNPRDRCGDNAGRLSEVLKNIKRARDQEGGLSQRPTIYTVGFGRPMPGRSHIRDTTNVSEFALCGEDNDEFISNNLEKVVIDAGSLQRIAFMGGGKAFVHPDPRKLKEAFKQTAPPRYRWYTYRYKLHSTKMREPFETTIQMERFGTERKRSRGTLVPGLTDRLAPIPEAQVRNRLGQDPTEFNPTCFRSTPCAVRAF